MMKMTKFAAAIALAIATGLLPRPAAAESTTLSIGTGVDPAFSAFYVADKLGIFEKNGLDVDLKTGPSGSAMVGLLNQNQLQAAFGAEQAGVLNSLLDPNVTVIAEGAALQRWFAVVGKNIPDLEGLKGKKIGVAQGTGSEIFWLTMLDKLGLSAQDYEVVNVDAPEMIAALERGDIDAYSAWEPWVSKGLQAIQDTKIVRDNEGIIEGRVYFYVNQEWATANPDAAKKFVASLIEATRVINEEPARAIPVVAEFLKLDEGLLKGMLPKIRFDVRLDQQSINNLSIGAQQLDAAKRLRGKVDWAKFVAPDLLKSAAPDKVSYELPK
jgi:ABC-type nitrate/sulfonate/bicarbonate transport system substrate-binding protein